MSDTDNHSNSTTGQTRLGGNNLVGSDTNDTIVGGSGDDTVSASGKVLAFGGSGVMNFLNAGSGSRGVSGGLGSVTVFGGEAGNKQLVAGQLPGEPIGAGSGDQLAAAGGNETLSGFGTTGGNVYFGGTGSDLVVMGAGAERYIGGQGNDVVVAGLGNDVIAGLKVHADVVPLQGFAVGANAKVSQTVSVSGGNTVLHLPDGTVVTLVGVTHVSSSSIA